MGGTVSSDVHKNDVDQTDPNYERGNTQSCASLKMFTVMFISLQ